MDQFSRLVKVTFLTQDQGGMTHDPLTGLRPNLCSEGTLWMSSIWTIDGTLFKRGTPTIAVLVVSEGHNLPPEWFMPGAKFELRDPRLIAIGEIIEDQ